MTTKTVNGQTYDLPDINVKLLDDTFGIISKHPEIHNQGSWATTGAWYFTEDNLRLTDILDPDEQARITEPILHGVCGAAFCFFGWAATLEGYTPAENINITAQGATGWCAKPETPNNQDTYEAVGQELLGLTPAEADDLSSGNNDIDDIEQIITDIKAGAYRTDQALNSIWICGNRDCRCSDCRLPATATV